MQKLNNVYILFILLTLSIIIIFSTWKGVNTNAGAYNLYDIPGNISETQVKTPIEIDRSTEPEEIVTPLLSEDKVTLFSQTQDHLNRNLQFGSFLKQQWALEKIQALPSPQTIDEDSFVLVAILDTGIDQDHEDLYGKVVAEINFTESSTTDDIYGHGTHVAGIIAAKNDNMLGIVGLTPESRLINVKVVDDNGRCQTSTLASGIRWAVNNGAKVINISIELRESIPEIEDAVDYAWTNGAIIIAAAGNNGNEIRVYPASYDNCLGVTAIQEIGTLAPLANHGDWVDVAAPGFDIYSTMPDNSYGYKHGTSFATAYVSGLAALLFPLVTDTNGDGRLNDEVRYAIEAGCRQIGIDDTGKGCINVANSLAQVTTINEKLQ